MLDIFKKGSPYEGDQWETFAQSPCDKLRSVKDIDRRSIAENLFTGIVWKDGNTGWISCPGQDSHTGKNGLRDCQVKIDGVPTIYCVHASCADEVQRANTVLRAAMIPLAAVVSTSEQKKLAAAAKARVAKEELIRIRAKKSFPQILKTYAWPYDQIVVDSPNFVEAGKRVVMFQAFLHLFKDDDVVWIGNVTETGQSHHDVNFKTQVEWTAEEAPTGPFTCPSCFVPGSISRSKDGVAFQRYLVVESDTLARDEVGAIFRWLDRAVELPLRAVVDTAGKSLHGWFDYPPLHVLEELKLMLPAMGCDPKMFGSSQPCRLPGGLRDGRIQSLIYLNGGVL